MWMIENVFVTNKDLYCDTSGSMSVYNCRFESDKPNRALTAAERVVLGCYHGYPSLHSVSFMKWLAT